MPENHSRTIVKFHEEDGSSIELELLVKDQSNNHLADKVNGYAPPETPIHQHFGHHRGKSAGPPPPPVTKEIAREKCPDGLNLYSFFNELPHYAFVWMKKFPGRHESPPPLYAPHHFFITFITAFFGIALPAAINFNWFTSYLDRSSDLVCIIGSFGASAVLLYDLPFSPYAQPRNVIGGHMVSAFCGVAVRLAMPFTGVPEAQWASCALAVACAATAMSLTNTAHPPGGATALIAVLPSPNDTIRGLGFMYVLLPVGVGVSLMVGVAVLLQNLVPGRQYPRYWF